MSVGPLRPSALQGWPRRCCCWEPPATHCKYALMVAIAAMTPTWHMVPIRSKLCRTTHIPLLRRIRACQRGDGTSELLTACIGLEAFHFEGELSVIAHAERWLQ